MQLMRPDADDGGGMDTPRESSLPRSAMQRWQQSGERWFAEYRGPRETPGEGRMKPMVADECARR